MELFLKIYKKIYSYVAVGPVAPSNPAIPCKPVAPVGPVAT